MNRYLAWAARWNVSPQAMKELLDMDGIATLARVDANDDSEGRVQSLIRLDCAKQGVTLFRNNVGALKDDTGRVVRYGLANDNAAFNKVVKSGDLIGWRELRIAPEHIGQVVAQFASVECKRADWKWTGSERELAQHRWIEQVNRSGGYARFANNTFTV